jgi:hypothetical protein
MGSAGEESAASIVFPGWKVFGFFSDRMLSFAVRCPVVFETASGETTAGGAALIMGSGAEVGPAGGETRVG